MNENNLFSFPELRKKGKFSSKRQKRKHKFQDFRPTHSAFLDKSASDFELSIKKGNLYTELGINSSLNEPKLVKI